MLQSVALRHHQADAAEVLLVQLVALVDAAGDGVHAVVEEVVVQLAVAAAKLLLLEEEGVVHEGEGVEDVEAGLLGEDEGVVHEAVEARLEGGLVEGLGEARLRGVVEEVGDA